MLDLNNSRQLRKAFKRPCCLIRTWPWHILQMDLCSGPTGSISQRSKLSLVRSISTQILHWPMLTRQMNSCIWVARRMFVRSLTKQFDLVHATHRSEFFTGFLEDRHFSWAGMMRQFRGCADPSKLDPICGIIVCILQVHM